MEEHEIISRNRSIIGFYAEGNGAHRRSQAMTPAEVFDGGLDADLVRYVHKVGTF